MLQRASVAAAYCCRLLFQYLIFDLSKKNESLHFSPRRLQMFSYPSAKHSLNGQVFMTHSDRIYNKTKVKWLYFNLSILCVYSFWPFQRRPLSGQYIIWIVIQVPESFVTESSRISKHLQQQWAQPALPQVRLVFIRLLSAMILNIFALRPH